jgi:hypothetical protein
MPETMRKLRLDDLAVETFDAGAVAGAERGTVNAHARCTRFDSCYCPSSIYVCGTVRPTASCTGD